ncbi:hypothetical protein [Nonomuraea sediminis]|uniref:hypothetical protein n=1 Tax=Nonomuraea sediminis TaxID=2835864 RepID=UPI001BDBDC5A|nr:hypothetical protein [Nonomuraea sediminis]
MLDLILHAFVTMNGFATHPVMLVVLALLGAFAGAKAVEKIPFTRRIIERREAQE